MPDALLRLVVTARILTTRVRDEEEGFSTAELLGNAALGVVALVVIWGLLRALGVDLVAMMRTQLLTNNSA